MKRNIIIGIADSTYAHFQANEFQKKLVKTSVSSALKKRTFEQNCLDDHVVIDGLIEDLTNGKIDLVVYELSGLNLTQSRDVTISGLSTRDDASYSLIMNKKYIQKDLPLGLKAGMRIGTYHPLVNAQLREVLRDIAFIDIRSNPENFQNTLNSEKCDAVVLPTAIVKHIDISSAEFAIKKLHPREFIPKAGQGIMAYITRKDDQELRKTLGNISDRETISISNIERRVEKIIKEIGDYPVGIYVDKDMNGFVHAYACIVDEHEQPHRVTISQSTSAHMAEKISQKLTKKII